MIKKIIFIYMSVVVSLSALEVYATFNIEAKKSANLAFYTGGVVNNVYVDVSNVVKKGDKLVELQNNDLKAALAIANASLKEAEISFKYAKKDYERQLLVKDLIDEERFDKFELAYEQSKIALSKAKANLAYQQSLLDRTIIRAPFSGIIFEKSVEVGDVVSGMMLRTIFKIQSKDDRKLILEFDQKYWKKVKVGDEVRYTVNGDKNIYKGNISKIYPFANSNNRKIKAEVKAKEFVVGLFGDGYIIVSDEK